MTEKQAYKILINTPIRCKENHTEYSKALHIALGALEKRIAREIDSKDEDDLVYGCHGCGEINALWKMNGDRNKFCGNCGQAILWDGDTE